MNAKIAKQIQAAQDHGRQKYGRGPRDYAHDASHLDEAWHGFIDGHNQRARHATPMERREHLIKLAGLAVSAIEVYDRRRLGP